MFSMLTSSAARGRTGKRQDLALALGDIVLIEGLDAFALRTAAAHLGTSDRMLIYYFGTKAELVEETLTLLSGRLADSLADIERGVQLSPPALLARGLELIAAPSVRPFMALWAEVVARSGRDETPYPRIARAISDAWIAWILERTVFPETVAPQDGALGLLALINGLAQIEATRQGDADPSRILAAVAAGLQPS